MQGDLRVLGVTNVIIPLDATHQPLEPRESARPARRMTPQLRSETVRSCTL
jgi:hypothetical protein